MDRHWQAPQVAYELAAERAEELRDTAAQQGGGPRGRVPDGAEQIGKALQDMFPGERRDVLEALAAQMRGSLWELRGRLDTAPGDPLDIHVDLTRYADRLCERARGALDVLGSPQGGPWDMPECSHCQAVTAAALIDLQCSAIARLGAEPAEVLRHLAEQVRAPRQREAAND